jgi:hypothetical protein
MRVLSLIAITVAGSSIASSSAQALQGYCVEPRAPTAYLHRPARPFCASNGGCEEWEISSYRSAVQRYFADIEQYARDVDRYYSQAAQYVECMSRLD